MRKIAFDTSAAFNTSAMAQSTDMGALVWIGMKRVSRAIWSVAVFPPSRSPGW